MVTLRAGALNAPFNTLSMPGESRCSAPSPAAATTRRSAGTKCLARRPRAMRAPAILRAARRRWRSPCGSGVREVCRMKCAFPDGQSRAPRRCEVMMPRFAMLTSLPTTLRLPAHPLGREAHSTSLAPRHQASAVPQAGSKQPTPWVPSCGPRLSEGSDVIPHPLLRNGTLVAKRCPELRSGAQPLSSSPTLLMTIPTQKQATAARAQRRSRERRNRMSPSHCQ